VPPAEFSRLAGGDARTAREWLGELELRPHEDRPFVLANFIATLDGRAAVRGSTRGLGSPADLEMLLELRCLPDAVLVGPGTLRAEGYGRLVRSEERRSYRESRGLAPDPLLVTITRGTDIPALPGIEQPVIVYADADSPREALADLRGRGVGSVLCEGGPRLFGALLADGLVDELCLTLAPTLTGERGAPRVVEGGALGTHVDAEPLWILRAADELFLRYALQRGSPALDR
jgi:riboflavin biosynthesis pyrimidine reductase